MTPAPDEPSLAASSRDRSPLLHAARVVRERWWIVAICVVVCAAVSYLLASSATKQYTATAELLVQPSSLTGLVNGTQTPATDSATVAQLQSTDVSLATSSPVANQVRTQLHLSESAGGLADEVSATADSSNSLIDLSVTDPSPARAAELADAFAAALVNFLNTSARANYIASQASIQAQLNALPAASPSRTNLETALQEVIELEAVANGGLDLVQQASVPGSPSSASVKREALLGVLVGVVLGLLIAFLLDLFDRRVKTAEEIEVLYGLPTLASIPAQRRRLTASRVQHDELSVFQILRGGLGFVSLRRDVRVVLVTSAVPAEGKTHVATGLALALAAAKKRVGLGAADVHRPAAGVFLGVPSDGRGLMNALVDSADLDELLLPVPDQPLLSLLPSGPHTPSSAELLRLPAMADILSELAGDHDFVVLDGPPLLPVADAQVLLDNPMIDGVLVVARPNLTTREQIRRVVAVLQRHPTVGAGLVVNGTNDNRHMYYYASGHDGNDTNGVRAPLGRVPDSRSGT